MTPSFASNSPIAVCLTILLSFWLSQIGQPLQAQSNGEINIVAKTTHTDYLPKYRQRNLRVLVSKVEYYKDQIAIHLRLVVNEKGSIELYGKNTEHAYFATMPSYGTRPNQQKSLTRPADLLNVRINDNLQMLWLPETDKITFEVERGDILSFELHFDKFPDFVKTLNIGGGNKALDESSDLLITDLLLKSKEHPALGTQAKMEQMISNFYVEYNYIKYPSIKDISPANKVVVETKKEEPHNPLQKSLEPVKNMPSVLNNIEDLRCSHRFILKNVYFEDNSAAITRRVQAMRTINMVYQYLRRYPESKIVLHGHTDVYGDAYDNLVLSKKRVLAIKKILEQKGIDRKRIIPLYHGGSAPLPLYKDGHPLNRRVEVEIICEEKTEGKTGAVLSSSVPE